MALTYVGNCDWEPSGEPEPHSPPHELPTVREPWIGRTDELATFLAAHAIGDAYLSGYIIENTPKDNTPFAGVASADIVVALAPDDSDYLGADGEDIKTATMTATVSSSLIIDGATEIAAERSVTFRSPQTRYTYFNLTRPTAARFSAPLTSAAPVILRSVIKATAKDGVNAGKEITYSGGTAPAVLVSALTMATVNVGTNPDAEPIPGTPWFRCSEVWTRELQGDA